MLKNHNSWYLKLEVLKRFVSWFLHLDRSCFSKIYPAEVKMRSYCKGNKQTESTDIFSCNCKIWLPSQYKILQGFKYNFKSWKYWTWAATLFSLFTCCVLLTCWVLQVGKRCNDCHKIVYRSSGKSGILLSLLVGFSQIIQKKTKSLSGGIYNKYLRSPNKKLNHFCRKY